MGWGRTASPVPQLGIIRYGLKADSTRLTTMGSCDFIDDPLSVLSKPRRVGTPHSSMRLPSTAGDSIGAWLYHPLAQPLSKPRLLTPKNIFLGGRTYIIGAFQLGLE